MISYKRFEIWYSKERKTFTASKNNVTFSAKTLEDVYVMIDLYTLE